MRVATSWSDLPDAQAAFRAAYQDVLAGLDDQVPDWLLVSATVAYDAGQLFEAYGGCDARPPRVHGFSSSRGVMTEQGYHSQQRRALAMWAIRDAEGGFGVGQASLRDHASASAAAQAALLSALSDAGRPGQVPALVWINTIPGVEEQVLAGIEALIGQDVVIMGGSAADDEVSGDWQLWSAQGLDADSVVLSVLFPSPEVFVGFQSGYEPTTHRGVVTRASGRLLIEIDGEPAAQVYDRWSGGLIRQAIDSGGGSIMAQTSMHPIGRPVNAFHGVTYHQLSHPAHVQGGLTLFSEIQEGDEVVLMRGTHDSLVERAGRAARSILEIHQLHPEQVRAALVIYCAGCMMSVEPRMPQVVQGLRQALPNLPFMGAFTFGEQGCFLGGENRHGNMMIAVMLLVEDSI